MIRRLPFALVVLLLVACQAPPSLPTPESRAAPPSPTAQPVQPTPPPAVATPLPTTRPTTAPSPSPAPRHRDRLYLDQTSGSGPRTLVVADANTGEVLRRLPAGVPAPDWSTLYVAECHGAATTVSALAVATGAVQRMTTVDGCFALPPIGPSRLAGGLSSKGRWLVLEGVRAPTSQLDYRGPSAFALLDTGFTRPPRLLKLDGSFSFDAIDDAGTALYLIENLPSTLSASIGGAYRVRLYDLTTQALEPGPIVDKTNSEAIMGGLRQTSVASPSGEWLFSLYLNDRTGPFVHALNLANHVAICLDLPTARLQDIDAQLAWSLVLAPDGRKLYAANGPLGLVVEIDPANASMRRTVQLASSGASIATPRASLLPSLVERAEAKRILTGGAALSPDGRMLYLVDTLGLLAIDTSDLALRGRLLPGRALRGVAASPSGERLYAVTEPGSILQVDPASGNVLSEGGSAWAILRVDSA